MSTTEDWKQGRVHLAGDGENWFTGGSKNREGAGAGLYKKNSDKSLTVPMGFHSIVLQTEITAKLQCANKAQDYGHRGIKSNEIADRLVSGLPSRGRSSTSKSASLERRNQSRHVVSLRAACP